MFTHSKSKKFVANLALVELCEVYVLGSRDVSGKI